MEAATPAQVAIDVRPSSSLRIAFDKVIANSERFKALSAKQQLAERRAKLRRHQDELRQPGDFVVRSIVPGLREKLVKLPFKDVYSRQIEEAEIRLLAELGHPNALHPLSPELREIIDIEMFDA